MTDAHIPQHTSDLRVTDSTSARDVREYLASRLAEPAVIDGTVVWNFNSHNLDASALLDAAQELDGTAYVVSYQVSGTWGAMVEMLPPFVADADLLTYQSQQGRYKVHENHRGDGAGLDAVYSQQELARIARDAVSRLDAEVTIQ